MNSTGFTTMTPKQLHLVYGHDSPYNSSEALGRLLPLNASQVHAGMEHDIHALATTDKYQLRQKDIVLSPILLHWIVLAPALVSQPIVLSPVVLS